jgi:3-dehydro-L-gulonate 2-dehydrogenase
VYEIIQDYSKSIPEPGKSKILYPGERVLAARKENTQSGIPVDRIIWKNILALL